MSTRDPDTWTCLPGHLFVQCVSLGSGSTYSRKRWIYTRNAQDDRDDRSRDMNSISHSPRIARIQDNEESEMISHSHGRIRPFKRIHLWNGFD